MADDQNKNQGNTEPDNGGNNAGNGGNGSEKTYTQQELDNIVNERTGRATKSALSSFFRQKGLSEDEANSAIAAYLDDKKKNTPDVAQLQSSIETEKKARVLAEIRQAATLEAIRQGVDSGSVPYLLKMADFDSVLDDNGKISSENLTEAVKKVLEDVPALKGTKSDAGSDGFRKIGGDGQDDKQKSSDSALRRALGLKD